MDAQKERMADKVMLVETSPVKCLHCDILLDGRAQFVGHMIHSHEVSIAHAEVAWESACIKCALG